MGYAGRACGGLSQILDIFRKAGFPPSFLVARSRVADLRHVPFFALVVIFHAIERNTDESGKKNQNSSLRREVGCFASATISVEVKRAALPHPHPSPSRLIISFWKFSRLKYFLRDTGKLP